MPRFHWLGEIDDIVPVATEVAASANQKTTRSFQRHTPYGCFDCAAMNHLFLYAQILGLCVRQHNCGYQCRDGEHVQHEALRLHISFCIRNAVVTPLGRVFM